MDERSTPAHRIVDVEVRVLMHQGYWGEEKTERILERYARFGLPLH